ncbi:MAG: TatD family deoxyribonuclease [Betaproteobacteria bacterium]|nr:TatD family deoxyribonuclease [Betaproteobacteria bacterium]NBY71638.1 TatD family deoxyribonuclease [Betaproteobacteria bacterium]
MKGWIDTHCHLDAPEFLGQHLQVRQRAASVGLLHCVLPAVEVANFDAVRRLAHQGVECDGQHFKDSYALGIHPLYVPQAPESDLNVLDQALRDHVQDPHLVAVGEIGLDFFVPELCTPAMRDKQLYFYKAQLQLAELHELPVILHVRRSADLLLKGLRTRQPLGGIAHAFNGSGQQAHSFLDLGFKLGFGGAVTFERAQQLRRLAMDLPISALVFETDAPDIPPHWLYTTAAERALGQPQGRNEPAELPRIAKVVAGLRGISQEALQAATLVNACSALPKLRALLSPSAP